MSKASSVIDIIISKEKVWREEMEALRSIALDCKLTEELKWGVPCYTFDDKNVVLIHVFKEYCALLFFNGALMKDPKGILIQQTKNVQVARQLRFENLAQIKKMKATIKAYILDAIAVQKAGLKAKTKDTDDYDVPEEFLSRLDEMPKLRAAFEALTPGRQRGYLLHFSGAKQSKTRASRVEKAISRILDGKGLDD